ncbi:hypothetical protein EYM_02215 [Ignicoccus islandicus DSM 13165]|uniref:Uncharacterized protein n=1 Tax=Ignicoccus islandicus DSM 13165 TaxID=940295 RepID=A0A0U2MAN4_9CREN|nr:hypothetical protein EYM_02215 [Ignicoccus islandicus DSM 13165]
MFPKGVNWEGKVKRLRARRRSEKLDFDDQIL